MSGAKLERRRVWRSKDEIPKEGAKGKLADLGERTGALATRYQRPGGRSEEGPSALSAALRYARALPEVQAARMKRSRKAGASGRGGGEPGRPRKRADQIRSKLIGVRVSETEFAVLERRAEGQPVSTWIREELLGRGRPGRQRIPRANLAIAGQLAKLGNNVNQLVRLAHTGRFPAFLEPLLKRVLGAVASYQRELLARPKSNGRRDSEEEGN
jgi:hypothetical protein